jgi:DNA-binding NarL/FixJ family response regulator
MSAQNSQQEVKSKGRLVRVKVAELRTNLFVRERLDEERVYALLDLHLAGVEIKPIEINKDKEIIDGRHRRMMYMHAEVEEIMALEKDITDPEELIAAAYKANTGGALPPSREDTEHTIASLVQRGASVKRIAEVLSLPPDMVRGYVREVKAKIERRAIQDALNDMANDGLTVQQAAEKYSIDADKLRAVISPKKKKERKQAVADHKSTITSMHRSLSLKEQRICAQIFAKLEDGEYTIEQVRDVLDHIGQLLRRSTRTYEDWVNRLKARAGDAPSKAA